MNGPLRILCVDDQEILGDVMLCLLSQAGYWVEHVTDGLSAWDRISADMGNYDVVVTDHQMPGLTGLEFVELLRQANYSGRIVVHGSVLATEEIEAYRGFGVESIVMKAARADELLSAVEAATC